MRHFEGNPQFPLAMAWLICLLRGVGQLAHKQGQGTQLHLGITAKGQGGETAVMSSQFQVCTKLKGNASRMFNSCRLT